MSEGPPAFQSLTFSPPHTAAAHTTSWTIQPVVFVLDPPSVALSHSQPSLSLCAITLLSLLHIALIFLFSCFEKSDILYLFYRNISDYPPAHLFFTFSFSFGLLLKICPNIFDVYFRLKLEKIFSLGFSFCLFFFSGWGGVDGWKTKTAVRVTGHTEAAISSKQTVFQHCSAQWTQEGAVDPCRFPSELTVQASSAAAAAVSGDSF